MLSMRYENMPPSTLSEDEGIDILRSLAARLGRPPRLDRYGLKVQNVHNVQNQNVGGRRKPMNIGIAEIRNSMADVLNRVAYQGERVVLERRGKGVAAIVSMEDLELLQALEDREDGKAARKALADLKRKGKKAVPLSEVKKRLGM
jgi:antitoxin Phd